MLSYTFGFHILVLKYFASWNEMKDVQGSFDKSLKALGLDYVDLVSNKGYLSAWYSNIARSTSFTSRSQ